MTIRPGDAGYVPTWEDHHGEGKCTPPSGVTRIQLREIPGWSRAGTYGEAAFIRPREGGGYTYEIVNTFGRVMGRGGTRSRHFATPAEAIAAARGHKT